jgi:hypothetical protein
VRSWWILSCAGEDAWLEGSLIGAGPVLDFGVLGTAAMGIKAADKLRCPSVAAAARSRLKWWMLRAMLTVLLWTGVLQLTAVGDSWPHRVLKGWPSCRTAREAAAVTTTRLALPEPVVEKAALPPKSEYHYYPASH